MYRITIDHNLLGLLEGRLGYYEHIPTITKHMCRIIICVLLRLAIFNLMHVSPIAGHMCEYKRKPH